MRHLAPLAFVLATTAGFAQAPAEKLSFDVASIRQNKTGIPPNVVVKEIDGPAGDMQSTNIPVGPEDSFRNTGGVFKAVNTPLLTLISFAYKITTSQRDVFRASLPEWVMTERYNVEARTDNQNVTKDQMRLMMQSLLAERLKLRVHRETREVNVSAVELVKPGTLGPHLRQHPADEPCSTIAPPTGKPSPDAAPPAPRTVEGGYPTICGGFANLEPEVEGHRREGARNMPMATIVTAFSGLGNLGHPAVDRTGLTGTFDFVIEFRQAFLRDTGIENDPTIPGPSFTEALKSQLGLKLEPAKAPIEFVIVDHVEHPSEN